MTVPSTLVTTEALASTESTASPACAQRATMMPPVCLRWMSVGATRASTADATISSTGEHSYRVWAAWSYYKWNSLNKTFSFALATNVPATPAGVARTATSITMNVNPILAWMVEPARTWPVDTTARAESASPVSYNHYRISFAPWRITEWACSPVSWYLTSSSSLIQPLQGLTAKLTSMNVLPTPASTRAPASMMWLDISATACCPILVCHVAACTSSTGFILGCLY